MAMCQQAIKNLRSTTLKLSSQLAMRKAQKLFLETASESNVCTSLRPKVGKRFSNPTLEARKSALLDECRKNLVKLGIEEASNDVQSLQNKYKKFFKSVEASQSKGTYIELSRLAKGTERKVLSIQHAKHKQKLEIHQRLQHTEGPIPIPNTPVVDRPPKHASTRKSNTQARNRRRRLKIKAQRYSRRSERVRLIKDSGFVVNFTEVDVPDSAYLFLAKGNSFVPAVSVSKHDIVFDINEFLRKLAWRAFFHTMPYETVESNDNSINSYVTNKLSLRSTKWPCFNIKLN